MGLKKTIKKLVLTSRIPLLCGPYIRKRFPKPPIIIGGCGRSGTTLLLSILGAHSRIYAIPYETGAFSHCQYECLGEGCKKVDFHLGYLYAPLLSPKIPSTCIHWCEKTPKNVLVFKEIAQYFHNRCHLIQIVRDGRDVVTSIHPDKKDKYWVSPQRWIAEAEAGIRNEVLPYVQTVRYEDLVTKPRETIISICDFIKEDFEEALLSFSEHTNVQTHSALDDGIKPLYSTSLKKWKNTIHENRVAELMDNKAAVTLLKHFGYMK